MPSLKLMSDWPTALSFRDFFNQFFEDILQNYIDFVNNFEITVPSWGKIEPLILHFAYVLQNGFKIMSVLQKKMQSES